VAYWLETDQFADDEVWAALAPDSPDRQDRLQAAYARLKSKAAHLLTDGYLTRQTALRYCRGSTRLLAQLTVPVLGRPPLLHRRGDQCETRGCLDDTWIEGYHYRIHAFLKRNPSRSEYNRSRAQRADLRDPRLRALVYARDGGCCRYCRSGPLSPKAGRSRDRRKVLVFDHVDPDRPAGIGGDNFVVACGRCNEHKGHRTPDEADMALLVPPEIEERERFLRRDLVLNPLNDHAQSNTKHCSDHEQNTDRNSDRASDGGADPDRDRKPGSTGEVRPQNAGSPAETHAEASVSGRGGKSDPDPGPPGPAQPARDPGHPDIYHRRSRSAPEYIWPAGSVPASPRHEGGPDA
jgi:5-methylcytosine-specific restriction endonuclease McrA